MKIELTKFLESLTIGLDYIEKEILGVSPYHGQRVAAITHKLATAANFDSDSIYFLTHKLATAANFDSDSGLLWTRE